MNKKPVRSRSDKVMQEIYDIFNAGVMAVTPGELLPRYIRQDQEYLYLGDRSFAKDGIDKFVVIAAGKAAAAMAKVAEEKAGSLIETGICITKRPNTIPLSLFTIVEAGHPVPDSGSIKAGKMVLEAADQLSENDLLLLLLSGGASSLLADTPPGVSLEDLQQLSDLLLRSGASITEINIVRKHLSRIKGGNLALAAYPAQIVTLVISDVVGDDPGVIASGPTIPDPTTYAEAGNVLLKYGLRDQAPAAIRKHIQEGIHAELAASSLPASSHFANATIQIIGNNRIALAAAQKKATAAGFHTTILTDQLTGDTAQCAREFVRIVQAYEGKKPACLLMGGETTLAVKGNGRGGRNQHFVLCALEEINRTKGMTGQHQITLLSAGTDGTDGPTDAAGAVCSNLHPLNDMQQQKMYKALQDFDSYHFFLENGGLVKTGATGTNVMDIIIGLIQ